MTDSAFSTVEVDVFATGDNTLADLTTEVNATDGSGTNVSADTSTTAIAAGDELATTDIYAQSLTDDGSGSVADGSVITGGTAIGDSATSVSTADTQASSTGTTDSASAGSTSTATADGDGAVATTESTSLAYAGAEDGSGLFAEADAYGDALGDGSTSTSSTNTFASDTGDSGVAGGSATSYASGETYQDTDALVVVDGDNTVTQSSGVATDDFSFDAATGIAVSGLDSSIDVDLDSNTDIDSDVTSDVDLDGNVSDLTFSVEAIGEDTLAEADVSVLATDDLSSVTGEMIAATG